MLGASPDGGIGGGEGLPAIGDPLGPDAEFRPEIPGEVEIRAEIEQCSLTDFHADPFRFDQPVGGI